MSRRTLLLALVLVAALLVAALLSRPAAGIPVRIDAAGHAVVRQNGNEGTFTAQGHAAASAFGPVTLTGHGRGQAAPFGYCALFTGAGWIRTADGTMTVRLAPPAKACASAISGADGTGGVLTIAGRVVVDQGTGTFAGRSGTLALSGRYDSGSGRFTVTFDGRLR